jgi:hypothetical protein
MRSYTQPMTDEEETSTRCPSCAEIVNLDDPDVQYTFELRGIQTLRGYETVDGIRAYFHADCRVPSGYRPAPKP